MSIPAYQTYMQVGLPWLEAVPSGWHVTPLKRQFRLVTEKAGTRENAVGLENVQSWTGQFLPSEAEFEGEGTRFVAGDILFGKLRPYLAKVLLATEGGGAVGDFHVLRPVAGLHPRFAQYQMLRRDFIEIVDSTTFGSKMPRASWEDLGAMAFVVPSRDEQVSIARFLDVETGKIDTLIAEQEKLIALLKEKRQAVISHVVTKGLNPDAPIKPSGIEWLGDVPAHWQVKQLKSLVREGTSISYGIVQPGDPQDEGVPFVQTTNMSSGDFRLEVLQRTTAKIASLYPRSALNGGEVLLGIRASIGAAFVAPDWLRSANLSRGVARIECGVEIEPEFLVRYLSGAQVDNYWGLSKQGSTFNEVSIETVRELRVPVPPSHEQRGIAAFLRERASLYSGLVLEAEQAMALLKERRSALISAAVTGQIDVRGLAA